MVPSQPGGWFNPYPYIGLASDHPADTGPPMFPTKEDCGVEHNEKNLFEPLVIPIPCPKVWLKPGMGTAGVAGVACDGDPGGCMKGSPNTRQCCFLGTSSLEKAVNKFLLLASPRSELSSGVSISLLGGRPLTSTNFL